MRTPLPVNYQARPGAEKLDLLWKNIAATAYPPNGLPPGEPGLLARLPLFMIGYLRTSVEHESDELPPGRAKLLHRYGSVARVRFDATTEQPYTGLLRGSHEGLLRISAATAAPSFTPALALKLFVDGRPSANIMAMNKNDGEGKNHDVFAVSYSNAVQPATRLPGTLLGRAFERAAKALGGARLYGSYLPLHDIVNVEANGTAVSLPVVPDRLVFEPLIAPSSQPISDWRKRLEELAENTPLFNVKVARSIDAAPEPLGRLTLLSRFVASAYGDDVLFFQHHRGPRKEGAASK